MVELHKMADQLIVGVVVMSVLLNRARRRRRNRQIWTREWIQARSRHFLRMDAATFDELLAMVRPHITFRDTNMRKAISPGERLAVTLRFLATG